MEDFVPFELAVKLKEKGYPQRTFGEYDMQGACYIEDGRFYESGCITEVVRAYTAPTISQVLKWLREEKSIHVELVLWTDGWYYEVWCFEYNENDKEYDTKIKEQSMDYSSYERAALAGIEYALDNLP